MPRRTTEETRVADQRTIGYITQSFPGLTTTFIYREVFGLRAAGFDVATFSIRRPDINLLSKESQGLVTSTHYAFPIRIQRLVFSHLAALAENPSCYLGTLFFLLTRPGESPSNRRRTFFHFMEAIYLLPKAKEEGIRHIHAHFCVKQSSSYRFQNLASSTCLIFILGTRLQTKSKLSTAA